MNNFNKLMLPNMTANDTHIAIYEKERIITYGELMEGIDNLSVNLLKTGAPQGSRVGLCFDNTSAFIYGYMAILGAKCIPVLLSTGLPAKKVEYILEDSGAIGILCDIRSFLKIRVYPSRLCFAFLDNMGDYSTLGKINVYSFEDGIRLRDMYVNKFTDNTSRSDENLPSNLLEITSIIYTSGTTGKPKGVMLTGTNLSVATSAIIKHLGLIRSDTCLITMSFAHCAGLLHLLADLRIGAKIVTGENPILIGPLLAAIKRHCVTVLPAVPSFYRLLLKHPIHKVRPYLQQVRAVESSSAMMTTSLIKEVKDLFPNAILFNTYGLTEAPRATYMAVTPFETDTNLSVGIPTDGVTIKVVNQQHNICSPYEEGEIILNGINLAPGYWKNPAKTSTAFCYDGFRTGDIGYVDENGFLFLKGRKDDMIKIGAEAVYPYEIEEVVASFPGVVDVLAYGVDDEILGYNIHVKVVCEDKNINEEAIIIYCRDKIEKFKIPSKVVFCDSIELEDSGKPNRGKAV